MTDLDNERKAFEEAYLSVGGKQRDLELEDGEYTNSKSQLGWELWQIKAKAQAVQQSFEIGRLQDRITELLDERQDLYAQINNDQAVPDTQQKLTDTYYLEGSDYVVDCPFEYDIEIDKGEVLELQKWQRTESTKVYFANIYKDEDNFEILQFASKAEAENAVAENLKFLEASESGAEQ
ncbi:TPA: hypothetical protein ACSIR4_003509 [Acinetobacter baumannii]|uniref:hypothetical protein n=1 Tax=Acinetobacter baumannii TaxID=470 RepID=UPI0010C7F0D5|nr:hypothetical protein [Acinetobacter baumannii]NDW80015.1 hypothetical protein [Acinetobacter baumannii]NDW97862.1 hypothetical protein [Acinetobacter baumannii]QCP22404.1 hypothetical protein FDF35_01185 [Acinetobacter baumannii]